MIDFNVINVWNGTVQYSMVWYDIVRHGLFTTFAVGMGGSLQMGLKLTSSQLGIEAVTELGNILLIFAFRISPLKHGNRITVFSQLKVGFRNFAVGI